MNIIKSISAALFGALVLVSTPAFSQVCYTPSVVQSQAKQVDAVLLKILEGGYLDTFKAYLVKTGKVSEEGAKNFDRVEFYELPTGMVMVMLYKDDCLVHYFQAPKGAVEQQFEEAFGQEVSL